MSVSDFSRLSSSLSSTTISKNSFQRSSVTILPKEALLDALYFLDRFSLDRVQDSSKLLLEIVSSNACSMALRDLNYASLVNDSRRKPLEPYCLILQIKATRETSGELKDVHVKHSLTDKHATYEQLLKFVRHSYTRRLGLGVHFTTDLVKFLREHCEDAKIGHFYVGTAGCNSALVREVAVNTVGPVKGITFGGPKEFYHRSSVFSNALLAACLDQGTRAVYLPDEGPGDANHYQLNIDGVMDFCLRAVSAAGDGVRDLRATALNISPADVLRFIQDGRRVQHCFAFALIGVDRNAYVQFLQANNVALHPVPNGFCSDVLGQTPIQLILRDNRLSIKGGQPPANGRAFFCGDN